MVAHAAVLFVLTRPYLAVLTAPDAITTSAGVWATAFGPSLVPRWVRACRLPAPPFADGDFDFQAVADLCERYGAEELAVFGSVARGRRRRTATSTCCTRSDPGSGSASR